MWHSICIVIKICLSLFAFYKLAFEEVIGNGCNVVLFENVNICLYVQNDFLSSSFYFLHYSSWSDGMKMCSWLMLSFWAFLNNSYKQLTDAVHFLICMKSCGVKPGSRYQMLTVKLIQALTFLFKLLQSKIYLKLHIHLF